MLITYWFLNFHNRFQIWQNVTDVGLLGGIIRNEQGTREDKWDHRMVDKFLGQAGHDSV